uniref:Uncharacterized protein n=1 Tax=Rhizophora mucronata TaxID=61149 RepID=A0A2P2MNS7_RHIMU
MQFVLVSVFLDLICTDDGLRFCVQLFLFDIATKPNSSILIC